MTAMRILEWIGCALLVAGVWFAALAYMAARMAGIEKEEGGT